MTTSAKSPSDFLSNFGLSSFRPGQDKVIDAVFSGRDTLCIMPTGGGKSLCYQLPSVGRDGVTIVVSPLIALMKDQVDSLLKIGIPATFINSSLQPADQYARINGMVNGQYKLVYVAPERLRSVTFMQAVTESNIQLLAVDEAHCISQWGHDFRPDYARLGALRERLGNPQTVALTATATQTVQEDIRKILQLKDPAVFVTGFARENLSLRVESPDSNSGKDERLIEFLKSTAGSGIVYASTRKNCEHIVELLTGRIKRKLEYYHAGLDSRARRTVQENFMTGKTPIVVATNAFGMGIDKANLRFVLHYNLPGSIEAYYQEAGRAGRDGKDSTCLMLYSYQDRFLQEFFVENSYPSREIVKQVYDYLCSFDKDPIEITLQQLKDDLGLAVGSSGVGNCENLLHKCGAIERLDTQQNMAGIRINSELSTLIDLLPRDARTQRHVMRGLEKIVGPLRDEMVLFQPKRLEKALDMKWTAIARAIRVIKKLEPVDYVPPFRGRAIHVVDRTKRFVELDIDFSELQRRKEAELSRLERMIRLATTRRCRQEEILEYFGDSVRSQCNSCDNCLAMQDREQAGIEFKGDEDAILYAIQVTLSGVARGKGRYGKTALAQMLTGSMSKKIKKMGLSKLSTFGLLSRLRQSDVVSLIEWLVERGYIHQVESSKFRPVVSIAPAGVEIMRGVVIRTFGHQIPIELGEKISRMLKGMTPHRAYTTTATSELSITEEQSETEPIDLSTQISTDSEIESEPSESGGSLGDSLFTQEESASSRLSSDNMDEYEYSQDFEDSQDFEAELENELNQNAVTDSADELPEPHESEVEQFDAGGTADDADELETAKTIRVDLPEPNAVKPSFYWTWRLLADGYSADHLRQVRGLGLDEIYDHAVLAGQNELPIRRDWLLTPDDISAIETLIQQQNTTALVDLLPALSGDVSPRKLSFFLACESGTSGK